MISLPFKIEYDVPGAVRPRILPVTFTTREEATAHAKEVFGEEGEFTVGLLVPDCYLHIRECRSGEEWIMPIRGNAILDLGRRVEHWVKSEYGGELRLDGEIMPRLEGDYYALIITDGRQPDSHVVWASGGFYLKGVEE